MRLTLIALMLAGVVGCGSEPADNLGRPVENPKPETENGGDEEPVAENGGDDEPESEFESIRKAAEQGDADAQHNLGIAYAKGDGVPKSGVEAVKWFRKAAEQGEYYAQRSLGDMYANGEGVPKDDVEAYARYSVFATYYDAATNYRYDDAKKLLQEVKAKLTPDQLAAAQQRAAELFEQINANKEK